MNPKDECFKQLGYLKGILSEAKKLRCPATNENLGIEFYSNKVWPHLEFFWRIGIDMSADDLKAITRAHRGTLRQLKLGDIRLHGEEGWADATKDIGKYLRLRRVRISGAKDYIIQRRTGVSFLKLEDQLAVGRSFVRWNPQTTLLDDGRTMLRTFRSAHLLKRPEKVRCNDIPDRKTHILYKSQASAPTTKKIHYQHELNKKSPSSNPKHAHKGKRRIQECPCRLVRTTYVAG